ncbi:Slalom [Operophtera brumata]|uniref:Adenosine 3'-phospho 5'-phosphosulfate transporter 1 n=1 Tax=Operophtera brumata TaxID=104452 RepID=A0A0L7LIP2_OPEBR|nr:Slalom [Operophtera brumata]
MVPGAILYKYLQKSNYFDKISSKPPTCLSRSLFACFGPFERLPEGAAAPKREDTARRGAELAFCFTGLMGAYLVWGLLQEKIMTRSYVMQDGSVVRFTDSQLLVLANRLGALLAALARLACTRRPLLAAPLYKFSYCSLTNVLSKSCKVIPVMLMGKLISRNKYELYEYVTAALISAGMVMFIVARVAVGAVGGAGGAALLALYLWCDSFTSSWQAALFKQYELHPLQMLAAVNVFSRKK